MEPKHGKRGPEHRAKEGGGHYSTTRESREKRLGPENVFALENTGLEIGRKESAFEDLYSDYLAEKPRGSAQEENRFARFEERKPEERPRVRTETGERQHPSSRGATASGGQRPAPQEREEPVSLRPIPIRRKKRKSPLPWVLLAVVLVVGGLAFCVWKGIIPLPGQEPGKGENTPGPGATASQTATPTSAPTPEPTPTPAPTPPPIVDDGSTGYVSSGLYIWNNKAFELFYGGTEAATAYGQAIVSYQQKLPGMQVYNMVVPNHSEFGLPQRIRDEQGCTSQRQNISDVYSQYTGQVQPVDIYDALDMHKNEYLYFNTDTHWAPLGAYYAYEKFCQVAGVQAVALEAMGKTTVDNYLGYLSYATGESVLAENPDHIDVYEPAVTYTASLSYDGSSFEDLPGVNSTDTEMGYAMLGWGDNPCLKVINQDGTTGRKLLMVKDSYGNALVPFLTGSFDALHVIDFRSFPGNLPAYCQENGITDVLFFNNVMSANTSSQIDTMNGLFD